MATILLGLGVVTNEFQPGNADLLIGMSVIEKNDGTARHLRQDFVDKHTRPIPELDCELGS